MDREDLDPVDPEVDREDPVDLAAGQEDSAGFPGGRVGREDRVEAAVAGVLQAVEHLTRRKSLK